MSKKIKTKDELIKEFVNVVDSRLTNKFSLDDIYEISRELNLKLNSTNGLPFNGNTYEIYRDVDINGFTFREIIGHFKYIYAIYGDDVYLRIYDYNCIGGSHLNGDESGNYIYKKDLKRRR
ncbi:MAG: hypothetical protein ACI4WW_02690 [Candidatus Coprovivens sp.]